MEVNSENIFNTTVKGLAAGAVGVTAMDYLVTWPMYKLEDEEAYRREKELQPDGKWAAHAAVKKTANLLGTQPSEDKIFYAGKVHHYLIGMAPAAIYAYFYNKSSVLKKTKGFLLGFGLFVIMDELVVPALGLSGPAKKYPWQAHLRGLLGHLMYGVATHYALEAISRKKNENVQR